MYLKIGVLLALLFLAVIGLFIHRRNASQDALRLGQQAVRQWPEYSADADYFESLIRQAHSVAISKSYSPPSTNRRSAVGTGSSVHTSDYVETLLGEMIRIAESEHKNEPAKALRELYKSTFGFEPHTFRSKSDCFAIAITPLMQGVQSIRSIATSSSAVTARRHSVSVQA